MHALRHVEDVAVVLVNQSPFYTVQTELHRYLGGSASEEDIYFDLKSFCLKNAASFICDKAVHVDEIGKCVTCKSGAKLQYDYLVIATGAVSFFPHQIENIDAYAKDIKIAQHLHHFQDQFKQILTSGKKRPEYCSCRWRTHRSRNRFGICLPFKAF